MFVNVQSWQRLHIELVVMNTDMWVVKAFLN